MTDPDGREAETAQTQREAFDRATYYDLGDGDELHHETVEELIEYYLEQHVLDVAELIRETDWTVHAYVREVATEAWVKRVAGIAAEDIGEQFDQEYAAAADEPKAIIDTPAIIAACEAAVWAVVNASEVYDCTEVAKRTYSAEEVEAMMREARPDWFVVPAPGAATRCQGNVGTPEVPFPCARQAGHGGAHSSLPDPKGSSMLAVGGLTTPDDPETP